MLYVDGFVVAVPKENKEIYIKHAIDAARVFKEHGALSLVGWNKAVFASVHATLFHRLREALTV